MAIHSTRVSRLGGGARPKSVPSSTLPFVTLSLRWTANRACHRGTTRVSAHRHRGRRLLYKPTESCSRKKARTEAGSRPNGNASNQEGSPLNNSLMTWRIRVSCASDRTPVLIFTVKLFTSLVMLPA